MILHTMNGDHFHESSRLKNSQVRQVGMDNHKPTIRLHLWLETSEGLFFGIGRAQLLEKIEKYGSLKKAAEDMGMSYRAAWGKIKKTEEILGFNLVVKTGSKRKGYQLTEAGRLFRDKFLYWYDEIEKFALKKARETFPWPPQMYKRQTDK